MANTNRSIQGRTDETEIEQTVATTLEIPYNNRYQLFRSNFLRNP
jgi:hypothetical protein